MTRLDLAVVIVTFNTRDLLLECLRSVCEDADETGRSYRVVVVDNASADGTAPTVRKLFPSVHLIENADNMGLAPALNQGLLACADAKYVLLMNSDVNVPPGTLGPMIAYLDNHPQVAGVGVRLVNPDGSPQKFRTSFGITLWPLRLDRISPVTFFGTTFHMGRRAMFNEDQVGLFDEFYFFFNEDIDWSVRAHRKGLVFHYVPGLPVIHYGGRGRAHNRSKLLSELHRMNLYFYAKFYGRPAARLMYFLQMLELLGKLKYLRLTGRQDSSDATAYASSIEKQRQFMRSLP